MKKNKNFLLLSILIILFILPVIVALWAVNHSDFFGKPTYKGQLAKKEVVWELNNNNKWSLVFAYNKNCASQCQKQILQIANMRLSLGRHLYALNYFIVLNKNLQKDLSWLKNLQDSDIQIKLTNNKLNQIFLLNQQNLLILHYPCFGNTQNIFYDLKKLLQ